MTEIIEKWNTFKSLTFPTSISGKEIYEINLNLLDTTTAGCISYFVGCQNLEPERVIILESCKSDLEKVIKHLNSDEKSYFQHLFELSNDILIKVSQSPAG